MSIRKQRQIKIKSQLLDARMIHLLLISLFMLAGKVTAADSIPNIELSSAPSIHIGTSLSYFIDYEDKWTVNTLKAQLDTPDWQRSAAESPNLGLQALPAWFAVRLNTTKDLSRILEISYPSLNSVDIYLFSEASLVNVVHTGNGLPFDERPIAHRNFLTPLEFAANTPYLLLIRVQTGGALQLPVSLWEASAFHIADQNHFAVIMLFTGIMFAMAMYNLLLYSGVRETSYLLYVLTVVAIAWTQLGLRGVIFQYVWPQHPEFNEIGLTTAIASNIIFVAFFSDSFLKIRNTSLNTSRLIRGFGFIGIALLIFSLFVPYAMSIRPLIALSFIFSLIVFFTGVYLWYRGEVLAKFYVIAWGMFLAGTSTYTLNKAGILPYTALSEHAMIIGASFQVLFLSFALAYRINLERRTRIEAQEEALHIQTSSLQTQQLANEQLEFRVQERTEELEAAYRELKRLSQIDGLTKVKNRQCFDQALEAEWRRNCRDVSNLSLLMIDVDFFKRINDTWGHPCGDACLQHIANICKHAVQRSGDTVARYGGEEFVLLLPSTDLIGASVVAEGIRKDIELTPFSWKNELIKLTVSLGLASSTPNRSGSYEQLIQFADEALYAAKAAGRNRVMVHRVDESGNSSLQAPPSPLR
tara:strand:- start:24319 stop:26241 length:1923 start_codon:yes stop_codon:yes gene_type:complete